MNHSSSFTCGLAGALASNPVDVVRTRMMNQRVLSGGPMYRGTLDGVMQTWRNEGFFALYKGFWPNWLRLGPWNIIVSFRSPCEGARSLTARSECRLVGCPGTVDWPLFLNECLSSSSPSSSWRSCRFSSRRVSAGPTVCRSDLHVCALLFIHLFFCSSLSFSPLSVEVSHKFGGGVKKTLHTRSFDQRCQIRFFFLFILVFFWLSAVNRVASYC